MGKVGNSMTLKNPDYHDVGYWDTRYESGPDHARGVFDWFPPPSRSHDDPVLQALARAGVPKTG